ncbi:hypothetical protein [uncultured Finegoldia sp.]|uniref:hypothetical protein n=1 Tax=uncultured Finegoldia sp. TaxID=328009 RepID=UPI0025F6113C|nr:hypothetical protein [uncultured Finegoldia sp.]
MRILYAIKNMEICINSVGARIEYFKIDGVDAIDDLKICIPNYGVDKTFRYPTDGLFVNEEYDVVSKSEDMCVLRLVREGIESFVVYQLTQDFVSVNVNVINNSDHTIKMNPAVVIDWKNNLEGQNIVSEISGCKLESVSGFVEGKYSFYVADLNESSVHSKFGLKCGEKCSISAKIRIVS